MKAKSLTKLLIAATASLLVWQAAAAQTTEAPSPNQTGKETLGPSADTIRPYRPAGRDPFKKDVQPKSTGSKGGTSKNPRQVGYPPLEARRADYRMRVQDATNRNLPEPNPVSQYLVSEVEITGIFRDDQGTGAFVKAQPTGTMFYVRRGEKLYNGEVLRIESDETDSSGAKVLFKEKWFFEVKGKQTEQERVVAKVPGVLTAGGGK
jgi:hypothetical protein